MAFSFNFSGDDIDTDLPGDEDGVGDGSIDRRDGQASNTTFAVEVKAHDVKEWVGYASSSSPLSHYFPSGKKAEHNLFALPFNALTP